MQSAKIDYSELPKEQRYEKARESAHRILKAREKSSSELLKRLQEKGHDRQSAESVVKRFVDVGLIDDERFRDMYIRSAQYSNKGWHRILQELKQRGIDTEYLEPPPYEEELQRAQQIIARLPVETIKQREKALRRLVTKGHGYGVAKRAIAIQAKGIEGQGLVPTIGNEHDSELAAGSGLDFGTNFNSDVTF